MIYKHKKSTNAFVLMTFVSVFLVLFQEKAKAASTNYKIDLSINQPQRTITGTEEVTIYNTSKEAYDRIFFSLGLNNSYDTKMRVTEVKDVNDIVLQGTNYYYKYLGQEIQDKSVYQVTLPTPLLPGENITLKLKFDASNLTRVNGILFLDDSINDVYNASWYPRLINYENGYWKKRDFSANNYEVSALVSVDEVLVTSGIELDTENLKARAMKKISYKINNARAFSIASTYNLSFDTLESKENPTIKSYYKSNKSSNWSKTILDIAHDVTAFYKKKWGFYPYKQLSIIPGNNYEKGGYANNNVIVLNEAFDKYPSEKEAEKHIRWLLAYYIAQQYFGFQVGESGEFPAWVTNGAAIYSAQSYMKEKNFKDDSYNNLIKQYIEASRANFNTQIIQNTEELRKGNFDWENILEKGKSAQVFKLFEYSLGRKILQDSLKEVLVKYEHNFITTESFQTILETHSNKDLKNFFEQWLKDSKKLDYAITKIKQNKFGNKYQAKFTLKRLGKAIMPVSISVTLRSGSKVFQVWDGETNEAELSFEYIEPVKSVQIDPANTLPDIDTSNNHLDAMGM